MNGTMADILYFPFYKLKKKLLGHLCCEEENLRCRGSTSLQLKLAMKKSVGFRVYRNDKILMNF